MFARSTVVTTALIDVVLVTLLSEYQRVNAAMDDAVALMKVFRDTAGLPNDWIRGKDPCGGDPDSAVWTGVSCADVVVDGGSSDVVNENRVTHLKLPFVADGTAPWLTGTVNLHELPLYLRELDLSQQGINGMVAAAHLPRSLLSINLSHASFKGATDVWDWEELPPNLISLDISKNAIKIQNSDEAPFPFSALPSKIFVCNNGASVTFDNGIVWADLPRSLTVFSIRGATVRSRLDLSALPPSLERLDLGNVNGLYGDIIWPASRDAMLPQNLKLIDLLSDFPTAQLTGTIDWLKLPVSLEYLVLAGHRGVGGELEFARLPRSLTTVTLDETSFTLPAGKTSLDWEQLPSRLQSLSMADMPTMQGLRGPESWLPFPNLEAVVLSGLNMTGDLDLSKLPPNLQVLLLGGNQLTCRAITSCSFDALINTAPKLLHINLEGNNLRGSVDPATFPPDLQTVNMKQSDDDLLCFRSGVLPSSSIAGDLTSQFLQAHLCDGAQRLFRLHGIFADTTTGLPPRWKAWLNPCAAGGRGFNGVTCDEPSGPVRAVDLANEEVKGTVDFAALFAAFPHITVLNLRGNFLTGTLLAQELPQDMTHLDISGDEKKGVFNSIGGLMNFSLLPRNMQALIISHNVMTGSLEWDALETLSELMMIRLQSNQFHGTVDWSALARLSPANVIDVSDNQFSGTVDWDAIPSSVTAIRINNNYFTGVLPQTVWTDLRPAALNLTTLRIDNNSLSGEVNVTSIPLTIEHLYMIQRAEVTNSSLLRGGFCYKGYKGGKDSIDWFTPRQSTTDLYPLYVSENQCEDNKNVVGNAGNSSDGDPKKKSTVDGDDSGNSKIVLGSVVAAVLAIIVVGFAVGGYYVHSRKKKEKLDAHHSAQAEGNNTHNPGSDVNTHHTSETELEEQENVLQSQI